MDLHGVLVPFAKFGGTGLDDRVQGEYESLQRHVLAAFYDDDHAFHCPLHVSFRTRKKEEEKAYHQEFIPDCRDRTGDVLVQHRMPGLIDRRIPLSPSNEQIRRIDATNKQYRVDSNLY